MSRAARLGAVLTAPPILLTWALACLATHPRLPEYPALHCSSRRDTQFMCAGTPLSLFATLQFTNLARVVTAHRMNPPNGAARLRGGPLTEMVSSQR